jgi:hypothetical protein
MIATVLSFAPHALLGLGLFAGGWYGHMKFGAKAAATLEEAKTIVDNAKKTLGV